MERLDVTVDVVRVVDWDRWDDGWRPGHDNPEHR
jgi:hypothetical protein